MEYKMKCNVCGKVFCYTDEDLQKNASNAGLGALSALGSLASTLGGGTIFHTHHLQGQADRYTDKIVDYNQCPYCHSRSLSVFTGNAEEDTKVVKAVTINTSASTESLLKRVFIFLEDGEWETADVYCEACLDKDPESAKAYLGKLMSELHVSTLEQLKNCSKPFDNNSNYQKILRYADDDLKNTLVGYIRQIRINNENAQKDSILFKAKSAMSRTTVSDYEEAVKLLRSIPGWKDADEQVSTCLNRIEELKLKEVADKLEHERLAKIEREEEKKRTKRHLKTAIIITPIVLVVVVFLVVLNAIIIPTSKQKAAYQHAAELLASGEIAQAAIEFGKLGDYSDAREQSFMLWDNVAKRDSIVLLGSRVIGLKADGTVIAVGSDVEKNVCNFSNWREIIALAATYDYTVGLQSDGTVVVAYDYSKPNLTDWSDIVAISAGYYHVVGLKADGTVVAFGENNEGQCNVSDWTDIVSIAAIGEYTLGLKSDGSVISTSTSYDPYGEEKISDWGNITAVSGSPWHSVGLKADGTVVAIENSWKTDPVLCDVSTWTNIVEISACNALTAGVKSDGTIVIAAEYPDGYEVSNWEDIVSVAVEDCIIVGIKKDGKIVATGSHITEDYYGQSEILNWKNIKVQ